MYQECTHLVSTTWLHLLPTLGHPKTGLHRPRTGRQKLRHLQVCFSLQLSLYFSSLYVCVTAPVRSDLSASKWITLNHATKKWVLMSHLLHIKIWKDKQSPLSIPIHFSGTLWISVKTVSLCTQGAEMSVWYISILERALLGRLPLCTLRVCQWILWIWLIWSCSVCSLICSVVSTVCLNRSVFVAFHFMHR